MSPTTKPSVHDYTDTGAKKVNHKSDYKLKFTFVKYKSLYKVRNAAVCAVISCKIKSEIRQAFEIKTRLLNPN